LEEKCFVSVRNDCDYLVLVLFLFRIFHFKLSHRLPGLASRRTTAIITTIILPDKPRPTRENKVGPMWLFLLGVLQMYGLVNLKVLSPKVLKKGIWNF